MIYWLKSKYDLSKIENEVISKVSVNEEGEQGESKKIDFDKLQKINSDVMGWIYIKDTDINYPIMKSNDNDYYLKRDLYKKYSSAGSIFMDYENNSDFSDENTIIYGHNLKNKKMFADLQKIYKGELGEYIEIYTKDTFQKYKIISVRMEEPNDEMMMKEFVSDAQRKIYLNTWVQRSKINFGYNIENNNQFITLITCDSTGKNRIIVNAQKI